MIASVAMVRACHVLGVVGALLSAAAPALADDEPGAEPRLIPTGTPAVAPVPPPPPETAATYSHRHQFGLSLRLGLGLRAIATYDDTKDYCGEQDSTTSSGFAPVCTGRAPFAFDFEASFGVARRVDAIVEALFAIESDFRNAPGSMMGAPHPVKLAPGARFFYSEGVKSKLFSTAQLVFDFTGYKDRNGGSLGNDFGVRNLNGLWIDLSHDYGAYAYVGETATFARWFDIELELGVGFQARFGK